MKPWEKNSKDSTFNEFYTTKKQCDVIFSVMIPIINKQEHNKHLHICCPCDSEQSEIPKYLSEHSDWTIDYFGDLDFNGEEARERMLKADVIITNPPFRMKEWRPFIEWLIANNKKFFIFGPLLQSSSYKLLQHVLNHTMLYMPNTHKSNVYDYSRPDGTQKHAITFFYTTYKVPMRKVDYEPAKEEQYYEGIPVYDRAKHIPPDYMDWMYVPVTSIGYLQPVEIDTTKRGVPGKYVRVCVRRKAIYI